MSSTNRGGQRHNDDFYATPAWCTLAILPHLVVMRDGPVLDPFCGDGAILRAVVGSGRSELDGVRGIEIDGDRAKSAKPWVGWIACRDAFSPDHSWCITGQTVLTNPPYSLAEKAVRRALYEVGPDGEVAFLLRLAFLASAKRADLHRMHPSDVYVLSRRPSFTYDGKTDSTDYAWFVWGPGRGGRWSILRPGDER
jgi:hypothetical protein